MLKYFLRRMFLLIFVLFGVVILVFTIGRLIPGDPARVILGERATPEMLENIREKYGLNEPIIIQFFVYIKQLFHLDLGSSITQHIPVWKVIQAHFMPTFELTIMATFWAIIIGIPIGILAAIKKDTVFDYVSMNVALFGVSMPVFWIGLILIMIFSVQLKWLPASGRTIGIFEGFFLLFTKGDIKSLGEAFSYVVMPSLALGSMFAALLARISRSSMLDALNENYIETARAKGLNERRVILKHALKNALIPIITVIGMQLGTLMGGAVLTESVFAWPGLGRTLVDSIYARDYPVFQGIILFAAMLFASINLLVDMLYALIDPRIKYN